MNLSDRAVLVQLSISTWTARKHDRSVTKSAVDSYHAAASAGRFNKVLLPGSQELDDVLAYGRGMRNFFYENTLAWGLEGQRVLPSANFLTFVNEMRNRKDAFNRLIDAFVDKYEDRVEQAKLHLGGMYNSEDYPPVEQIRKKFAVDLATFPVPTSDFRVQNISDEELEQVRGDVTRRVLDAQKLAMNDAWGRLKDRVEKFYEKMADPASIFRDTLVENMRETCDLLSRLNVMDDPDLNAIRDEVRATLAGYDPDSLRLDPDLRSNTAAKAKAIMDKMAVFMGDNT
jgi:hypothetical protein